MTIQEVFSFLSIDITTDKDVIDEAYQQKLWEECIDMENSPDEFIEKIYAAAMFYADNADGLDMDPCEISLEDYTPTKADFAVWDARQAQCLEDGAFQEVVSLFYEIQPFFPQELSIYERTAEVLILHSVPDYWVRDFVATAEANGIGSSRITILQLRCMRLRIENGEAPETGEAEEEAEEEELESGTDELESEVAELELGTAEPGPAASSPDTLEDILCYAEVLLLEQQEDEASPELCAALMAEMALIHMDLEQFPEALEDCLNSIELMPIHANISNYGYIAVEERRRKRCLGCFYNVKHMNGIYDLYASYCMNLAKFYKINNCPNEASAYYRRVLQNYPVNGRIFGEMGALCYQRMQRSNDSRLPGDALYFLNHQVEKSFVKAPSYLVRGKVFLHQKEYAKAHKDVDAVIANKKEEKLLPEALLLKARILLAERPAAGQKALYFIEKAYDSSSKIMDELSSKHWVEVIPATLARDCCGVAFSYWEELLDSIAEIYRQILLCMEIISLGEELEQKNGNAKKAHIWETRVEKQMQTSGDICKVLNSQLIESCAYTAPCTESVLRRAPSYALRRMEPEDRELIESLM